MTNKPTYDELVAMVQQLKAAHEQLSVIMESLPIIPYTRRADGDLAITFMGKSVETITGYAAELFMDDPAFWLDHVHPDDRTRVMAEMQMLINEGILSREYRLQVADGSYKWMSSFSRMIKDSDGRNDYIVGVVQDVSDEKKMKQEADMHMQQVIQADKLASLGEVVAGVAHEINNPNSFITYNIPLLEESWEIFVPIINAYAENHPDSRHANLTLQELTGEMGEIIHAIKTGSDRINKIVANLKDFARLDESAPSSLVDFNKVINDVLTIVGAQARKSVARIELELEENLPQFHGHYQKLEQVMANLIMNAAQAIPEKEKGKISIRTRVNIRLHSIIVEVEDNGRGMAPSETEHIFEPFFTTRRSSGGTGLGLSVSYGLVQEHKGRICVLSRPGLGTKFTVILPIDRRQSQFDLQSTILCVDEEPQTLVLLNSFFARVERLPALSLTSTDEVISFLQDHPEVDMVLCDKLTHEVVGWPMLGNIKRKFPLLTVFCLADLAEKEHHCARRDILPDYFLARPLQLEKLAKIIKKIGRLRI
ncbi:MAG: PAS domain-containing protein [Proteobacteria bacterium]|nr:PAS domain-containing protein [Pseudomonadota bacterium]MBU4296373.1 PAS domain-containing protein [Pseudomonadota bacterium]MCG2750057.1 ATP-binding protein [Desulfobulbaceae bacterium]